MSNPFNYRLAPMSGPRSGNSKIHPDGWVWRGSGANGELYKGYLYRYPCPTQLCLPSISNLRKNRSNPRTDRLKSITRRWNSERGAGQARCGGRFSADARLLGGEGRGPVRATAAANLLWALLRAQARAKAR